ncbi:MAG: fused MFS/spermidine synthase [Bacteroidia bacterium]|nr:fused MFS/spermidine synthase [Bacteroidia bacterium]
MKKSNSIYVISFFEGAAVMATELCGSKLISPYFGSSLYVWASVIAITLGSLAAGYFYGGKLSLKENRTKILATILLVSAAYMGFMPIITNAFASIALSASLVTAVVMASVLLLVLPMFLMGAASPIIIAIQTENSNESGRVSGLVYSISTVGGIISTFLCGFFLIPMFGVNTTLIVFALLLASSLILLSQKKNNFNVVIVLVALLVLGFTSKTPLKNCIYEVDGMLGKINVLDDTIEINGDGMTSTRKLLVNNIVQTEMDMRTGNSLSGYVNLLDFNIDTVESGNALVLGLGGGVTSNLLVRKGFKVTGVELDERIIDVAKNYFNLNESVSSVYDDGRHFINQCNETYNLILIDIFKAEEQPSHVLTMESLEKIKKMMSPNASLIINWHGYLEGERGIGTSILLNTLKKSDFNYKIAATSDKEDERNLVFFASLSEPIVKKFEVKPQVKPTDLVNSDGRPVLERYNALANQSWRKNYILYYYSGH